MDGFLRPDGTYYEGERESEKDQLVPPRPAADQVFDGWQWNPDPVKEMVKTTENINAVRDGKIFSGVTYKGNRFDSDPRSIMNLTATIAAVANGMVLSNPFYWRSQDNLNVVMSIADLQGLAEAMLLSAYAIYLQSWTEKDAL